MNFFGWTPNYKTAVAATFVGTVVLGVATAAVANGMAHMPSTEQALAKIALVPGGFRKCIEPKACRGISFKPKQNLVIVNLQDERFVFQVERNESDKMIGLKHLPDTRPADKVKLGKSSKDKATKVKAKSPKQDADE